MEYFVAIFLKYKSLKSLPLIRQCSSKTKIMNKSILVVRHSFIRTKPISRKISMEKEYA